MAVLLKGRSRIRIFGSHGRVKTEEFGPGQVAFIKQGYGHYIEQIGNEPTEILILFNSRSLPGDFALELAGRESSFDAGDQLRNLERDDRSAPKKEIRDPRAQG